MKKSGTVIFGIIGWVIAIIIFFPIFWMTITAFKTERGAYSPDIIFMPTLESFRDVFARSNYLSVYIQKPGGVSTLPDVSHVIPLSGV